MPEIMGIAKCADAGDGAVVEEDTSPKMTRTTTPTPVSEEQTTSPVLRKISQQSTRLDNINNNSNNYNESVDNLQHFMVKYDHIMSQNKLIFNKINGENKLMRARIIELEDALKESVTIVANREGDFEQQEKSNSELKQKIAKLEIRILSLQNANKLSCGRCKNYRMKFDKIIKKLSILSVQHKKKMEEITTIKQNAIESAISDKDSRIAVIEVTGAKSQHDIEILDQLRSDRNKLNYMLKVESENFLEVMSEYQLFEDDLSELLAIKDPILEDFD